MTLRALLFDFDGLICDTERAAFRSWAELYAEHGLTFQDRVWVKMAGRPKGAAYAAADLSERLGRTVDDSEQAARLARKRELCEREPLRPGVSELIDAAAGRGLRLAVVSSSPRSWVEGHLTRLGVGERFAALVTGDEVAMHKPAPDLYRLALRRLGVAEHEALAFEDSPTGVRAAVAAGVRCVAVPGAVGAAFDLNEADAFFPTLEDFLLGGEPFGLARMEV